MSGERNKRLGAEGAVMLAPEIIDNGALSSLNLASNSIGGYYTAEYPGQSLEDQTFTAAPEGSYILLIPAQTYD
jgi:hypothetical protein